MIETKLTTVSGGRATHKQKIAGLSVSQWLLCPLAMWAFTLEGSLDQSCQSPMLNLSGAL